MGPYREACIAPLLALVKLGFGLERPPIAAFPRPGPSRAPPEHLSLTPTRTRITGRRAIDLLTDLVTPGSFAYLFAARWGVFLTSAGRLFLELANREARYLGS